MKNKKVTFHNNHLIYINQDVIEVLQKRTWWRKCKDFLTMLTLPFILTVLFVFMAYCLYMSKYL